ncbi:hypothetical protein SAMN05216207_105811 [Pseudonocardia ammonioxydans]|uniref:Phosphatidylethanolamine-binding protein n=1 Tax=Pseudonocardia ammonioxydans TaxID=260086 RepID=A0A1I5H5Z8_PSUAM|nr:YbhB/YbcL family Raf kinase inhibitor-like protein [Pseudonocardia ammonioxydans]SFO43685.1 hypothetical protein SAMN05216207_105811 [Pseudonocardia ammonioxydans]
MPDPGSHAYDVKRTRLRAQYDDEGTRHTNDGKADRAANAELERDYPPRTLGDPDRAAGPRGERGGSGAGGEALTLRSTAFVDQDLIPAESLELGPPLEWTDTTGATAEYALVCEDRDADDAVYWLAVGIPKQVTGITSALALPDGAIAGHADDGTVGWRAPQPPVGDSHRLVFRLLAVDRPLGLGKGVTPAQLQEAAEGHVIAHGTLVGVVTR